MKEKLILFLLGLATSLSLFIGLASLRDQSPNSASLEPRQTETTPIMVAVSSNNGQSGQPDQPGGAQTDGAWWGG